ncbi:MAG: 3-methyladenine DNA glycosylase [Candidatus Omnitrophica bacterium CG11_big_fil_rev_8_21_14_0_20_45_26]|uniref:Putative 3-methyladenine DNA glycosylase n=1 Tax=Candidatus Abzuiibacterium crystallinum TaxID=1974748 RepID=A0A2H0LNM9_9BACT|nr:MAG: 3-methyladenine DNA glycosylase [Candidatus Omnitrophica bacterium CG11_big_fil_rev_8_21_14_0_20_45_26]PIW65655.1 MAG: 3-methyladenine DNA glycosylase [Candidatus Omnitrophica bacterium CG12_big_fil_rev_8_21_14_0_65_45_16]
MLDRSFYERDTRVVAIELIGKILVFSNARLTIKGRIVETEAYFGSQDPASHAYHGRTPRNQVMFGPPGFSYVYFTYGFHHCFNVVTEKEGTAGAVLIRALEPLEGIDVMKERRQTQDIENLTSGPGKLTQAFGLTRDYSGLDLTGQQLFLEGEVCEQTSTIQATPRIGIKKATKALYRFILKDSPYVSI